MSGIKPAADGLGDGAPLSAGSPGAVAIAPAAPMSRRRLIAVDTLIVVTTVLAVVGIMSVWTNRLLFNPAKWEATSTQLLQNTTIRETAADYIVNQLYAHADVAALIRSGLPPRLRPLAAPAAGAVQNVVVQEVRRQLGNPAIQTLWAHANRAAAETFVAIVKGGKGVVRVDGGVVTLNLASVTDAVAARIGLPSKLGSKLPPSIAELRLLRSDQLKLVQDGGNALRRLALWLTILVPLLYGLAIVLARARRRRTLMSVGFAIVIAGIAGYAIRILLKSQIVDALVKDATLRPAVRAVVAIMTSMVGEISGACIVVGLVVIAAAWFAGPARVAVAGRRALAPHLREHPAVGFAVTATVMLLIFIWNPIPATGSLGGIIVFAALALVGTGLLRRQSVLEFPKARSGDTAAAIRSWVQIAREPRRNRTATPTLATASVAEQLQRLAVLRDAGTITSEEFDRAKARLLED